MNSDNIKKENRKALKLYIPIVIACAAVGATIGFLSEVSDVQTWAQTLKHTASEVLFLISPYAVILLIFLPSVWALMVYRSAAKLYAKSETVETLEEEEILESYFDEAERKMSFSMAVLSVGTVAATMFFGITLSQAERQIDQRAVLYMISVAVFLLGSFISTRLSQLQIDMTKRMNPSKRGSVYDLKFHQKWEESCDEAEKLVIYRSSYKAFRSTCLACSAGWVVLGIGSFIFDYGPLPVIVISVVWLSIIITYYRESMRLEHGKING